MKFTAKETRYISALRKELTKEQGIYLNMYADALLNRDKNGLFVGDTGFRLSKQRSRIAACKNSLMLYKDACAQRRFERAFKKVCDVPDRTKVEQLQEVVKLT